MDTADGTAPTKNEKADLAVGNLGKVSDSVGTLTSPTPVSQAHDRAIAESFYQASPIRRKRRTAAEVDDLFYAVANILNEYEGDPITIRHLFYRLASKQVIAKDEKSYDHLISHLGKWRINGSIPFDRFVDGTRWHYGVDCFDDAAEAMEDAIRGYRKNLWRDQHHYVEVWCEKEAIASLVKPVADQWGLRTFVSRGFNSLSASAAAAHQFTQAVKNGKRPVILYLGDHDPSGLCIDQSLMKHLSYFTIFPKNEFRISDITVAEKVKFIRIAILPEQIEQYNLPTRPVKNSDTRSRGWEGGCVEIDTLSGREIRELLEAYIDSYIDGDQWRRLQDIEKAERETLANIMHLHHRELEECQ